MERDAAAVRAREVIEAAASLGVHDACMDTFLAECHNHRMRLVDFVELVPAATPGGLTDEALFPEMVRPNDWIDPIYGAPARASGLTHQIEALAQDNGGPYDNLSLGEINRREGYQQACIEIKALLARLPAAPDAEALALLRRWLFSRDELGGNVQHVIADDTRRYLKEKG